MLILKGQRSHTVLAEGFLFTDSRYHLVAKSVLPRGFKLIDTTEGFKKPFLKFLRKNRVRHLGFEGNDIGLAFYKKLKKLSQGISMVDIRGELAEKRIQKKSHELRCVERAQEITDEIFLSLKKWLKYGLSEKAIAWKIEEMAHLLGADDISFPPIIGINEHSASPHHQNTDRKLKRGDMILIDMGVIYKGYCSDMTRVLFTKPPTPLERKIYELVLEAQETAIEKIRAGMSGKNADSLARSVITKAGYGKYFGHSLGHGVGLDIHELPNLSQKYTKTLPQGSVVTVEPGIYLPGKFGVRLEDMMVVGKNRVRNLTKSPKAIQTCIIRLK